MRAALGTQKHTVLRWLKPDEYHIRSDCGRFSVARVTVGGELHYIAWSWSPRLREISSVRLPASASDDERLAAIRAMQHVCQEHAQ